MLKLDTLISNVDRLLTLDPIQGGSDLGVLEDAAVGIVGEKVAWIGPTAQAPGAATIIEARGLLATPGLVDCHTHAVWAGSRASEWRRRLSGVPYAEILEQGGGILSTVAATRAASDEELLAGCVARLRAAASRGITTVEIKSGYGLDPAQERRCLRIARRAGEIVGVRVFTTFLGAHTIPPELRHDREAYVQQVIQEQLPAVLDVADFADVFIDRGAFTLDEGERILRAAQEAGLGVRVHAEQLSATGAASLAARLGALSADHLERLPPHAASELARAGTVAVLLPGACLYLNDPSPPVQALRDAEVPMAVATDLNPGSSPTGDLWACATLACVLMGLTIEEALVGITRNAGRALGRSDLGILRVGGPADLALYAPPPGDPVHEDALVQRLEGHRATLTLCEGRVLYGATDYSPT
ncbi:MAG: imidazolonepropionase [Deltaproteobacteria bacterium]|nr:MAG: imidazolonepropionase [Deltaproteobacteria bacterium]